MLMAESKPVKGKFPNQYLNASSIQAGHIPEWLFEATGRGKLGRVLAVPTQPYLIAVIWN